MEQQRVVSELKRVAELLCKTTLSIAEFDLHASFNSAIVKRTFGSWNKAIQAAGLQAIPNSATAKYSDDQLATEFRRVQECLGKIPSRDEFAAESKISLGPYMDRFGRWSKVVEHYSGVLLSGTVAEPRRVIPPRSGKRSYLAPQPLPSVRGKRMFGSPTDFRGLRHEPTDEQGVVFVFGMVAKELGFLVEAVGTGYPDCTAKRQVRGGKYIQVDIEFEFKSSNFREHGHDPAQCDLVVCWEHDWIECPVEVLELKQALKQLGPNG